MINIEKILDELLKLPSENEVVEFKEAKAQFDFNKLGKYFSALSNEANLKDKNEGWLVFGIRDAGKSIVGSQFRINHTQLQSLKAEIANHTSNRITFLEIYEINKPEGRVVLFQIPAAPKGIPVAWKGHFYGRDGEELNALNLEELERIRTQSNVDDWSSEICNDATLEDLSIEAIAQARDSFTTKNPSLIDEIALWDDLTFLNKARICNNGKITNAAILLLGKPESENYLTPSIARITWILKDQGNIEKDYSHFSCPLLINSEQVFNKIRNLKYRYISGESLFPDEVDQYDPFLIREALNNCIAHQDYRKAGRINVVEREDGSLIFTNVGSFIPGSIERVILQDAPQEKYRNPFLAQAMVNLNMIDTIGSGIKRMFTIQRKKLFPMPDYDFSENKVSVGIIGKVLDLEYARSLSRNPSLSLLDILLLDKVQKSKPLTNKEIQNLRGKKLIEGRKPNFYISSDLAEKTGQKSDYIKMRRFKDDHYKNLVLEFLSKYKSATKDEIYTLLFDILPDVLDKKKKDNKIRNLIYAMSKKDKTIVNLGTNRKPIWKSLSKS